MKNPLYGLFVGDALGVINEFKHGDGITKLQLDTYDYHDIPRRNHLAGDSTDDGEMALATIDTLETWFNLQDAEQSKAKLLEMANLYGYLLNGKQKRFANKDAISLCKQMMDNYSDWLYKGKYTRNGCQDVGQTVHRAIVEYDGLKNKSNNHPDNIEYQEEFDNYIVNRISRTENVEFDAGNGTLMKQAAISYFVLKHFPINKTEVNDFDSLTTLISNNSDILSVSNFLSIMISRLTHDNDLVDGLVVTLNSYIVINCLLNESGCSLDKNARFNMISYWLNISGLKFEMSRANREKMFTLLHVFIAHEPVEELGFIDKIKVKLGLKKPQTPVRDWKNSKLTILDGLLYEELEPSGYSYKSFICALHCLMNHNDFEDGLLAACNLGGDADTIAAIYGQLAGSVFDVPEKLITPLYFNKELEQL